MHRKAVAVRDTFSDRLWGENRVESRKTSNVSWRPAEDPVLIAQKEAGRLPLAVFLEPSDRRLTSLVNHIRDSHGLFGATSRCQ
jgi:hypothetical protein